MLSSSDDNTLRLWQADNGRPLRTFAEKQIWILPKAYDIEPGYEQKRFAPDGRSGLTLIASPDGRDGSVTIHQDASVSIGRMKKGEEISRPIGAGRSVWLQMVGGSVALDGHMLKAVDGAALKDEALISLQAAEDAEYLLFEMWP